MRLHVFIIVGEPSGDVLGANLMRELKANFGPCEFSGIGGELMEAEGIKSLFPMHELSVIGLAAILRKYRHLKQRIKQTAAEILAKKPDIVVTIDAQEFSKRVVKIVKSKSNIHTVHYVLPTVWAWRPGRAKKLAEIYDQLLAVFPFEPPLFEKYNTRCDFVGHPTASLPKISQSKIVEFQKKYEIAPDAPLILVLPGSRHSEITRHCPLLLEALKKLQADFPDMRVVLVTIPRFEAEFRQQTKHWPGDPIIICPNSHKTANAYAIKQTAFAASEIAIAASGTVTLELAAARTPMIVIYKMNWLSYYLIKALIRIKYISLINIVSGEAHVPELHGADCTSEKIAQTTRLLLCDTEKRNKQIEAMKRVSGALGAGREAPAKRAAYALHDGWKRQA